MPFSINTATQFEGDPVKGSRFIVDIAPAANEDDARAHVTRVAQQFPDASHHCWACRIATPAIDRASDDGEPSGSAGRPILSQLIGRDLVDVVVVVTRYFGGTKLGVGGLVRAYGGAAGSALDRLELAPWIEMTELTFEHDYTMTDAVEHALTACSGQILDRTFGAAVRVHVQLPASAAEAFATELANASAGKLHVPREQSPD